MYTNQIWPQRTDKNGFGSVQIQISGELEIDTVAFK